MREIVKENLKKKKEDNVIRIGIRLTAYTGKSPQFYHVLIMSMAISNIFNITQKFK